MSDYFPAAITNTNSEAFGSTFSTMSSLSGDETRLNRARIQRSLSQDSDSNSDGLRGAMRKSGRGYVNNDSSKVVFRSSTDKRKDNASKQLLGEGFTLNRLCHKAVTLAGRQEEISQLKAILQSFRRSQKDPRKGSEEKKERFLIEKEAEPKKTKRALVFIAGEAGTGKTSLAMSLKHDVQKQGGALVAGKFDHYLRDKPYSGIIDAMDELCTHLNELKTADASRFEKIKSQIVAEFQLDGASGNGDLKNSEFQLLANMVPGFETLFAEGDVSPYLSTYEQPHSKVESLEKKNQQFKYIFKKFFRLICSELPPIVIVLDDLQWSDAQSLELLHVLATDRENSNLMIIGLYRPDDALEEENRGHGLMKTIQEFKSNNDRYDSLLVQEMTLNNLNVDQSNEIIMALLQIDDADRTRSLAEVCHKRTLGNPFFLIAFMTILAEESLIEFNFGLCAWQWDVKKIEEMTAATANAVDMFSQKMNKSPKEISCLLKLAACLGSTFDERMLEVAWYNHKVSKDFGVLNLKELVNQVLQEQFLETDMHGKYRWVHDNLQEAAIRLIPEDQLTAFQCQLGMILVRELKEEELSACIFVVVNLLNHSLENNVEAPSPFLSTSFRLEEEENLNTQLARLNLCAAEKAKENSAFVSAAKYALYGICSLPENAWEDHFPLALDLYSVGAEAEGTQGNTEVMERYSRQIVGHEKASVSDKMRVYNVMIESKANAGNTKEAINLCLDVLDQLGCKFPKSEGGRVFRAITTIVKLKKKDAIPTNEEIEKLPRMKDRNVIECMRLMQRLGTYCFTSGDVMLMILVATRQVRWTLRYGLDTWSPLAFTGYGTIMIATHGDFDSGNKCAELAISMLDRLRGNSSVVADTLRGANFLMLPWRNPIQNTLKPLESGFELGMKAGDTECACHCLSTLAITKIALGKPLPDIDEDCRSYVQIMEDLKGYEMAGIVRIEWQMVLNLMGQSSVAHILVGEVADEFAMMKVASEKGNGMVLTSIDACKSFLYAHLGEHERGAALALKIGDKYIKALPGVNFAMWETFCRAMSLYAMARKTQQRKYKKAAAQIRKTVKAWYDGGNPNVYHHLWILNAEHAASVKRSDEMTVRAMYGEAISVAAKRGFIHDAAMACESFAELVQVTDPEESSFRLRMAINFYEAWGATHKVEILREKYSMDSRVSTEPPSTAISLPSKITFFSRSSSDSPSRE